MTFPTLVILVVLSFLTLLFVAHKLMGNPSERTERYRRGVLAELSAMPSTVVRLRLEELDYFDFSPGLGGDPPDGTPMRDTAAAEALFDEVDAGLSSAAFESTPFGTPLKNHFRALAAEEAKLGYSADPRWGPWIQESGAWEPIVLHAWAHALAVEREKT